MGVETDSFFIGERVDFTADFTYQGVAAVPSAAVLTVRLPDGSEVTPPVTLVAAHASANLVTSLAGIHEVRWASTGSVISAKQGRFRVVALNV